MDDNDLESLRSYSSMVTEFILTDVDDVKNVKPIISSSTFCRIAQFLEPNSGLLPSLSSLRIIQADIYIPYLHLLYTPSLRSLEANVPVHQHPNFFSFLTTLVHKAPFLEEIILGPCQFPLKSLQAILKFTYLRHLELRDATSTIDFTFLQDVGTLLNLESFILDARSCKYTARIPEKEEPSKTLPAEHTEAGSKVPQLSSDIDGDGQGVFLSYLSSAIYDDTIEVGSKTLKSSSDIDNDGPSPIVYPSSSRPSSPTLGDKELEVDQIPSNKDSSMSVVGGFYHLKKFHFFGGFPMLQDMILYIASSTLEDIFITVYHLSQDQEAKNMRKAAEAEMRVRRQVFDKEIQLEIEAMEKETKKRKFSLSERSERISLARQGILEKAETQWKEKEAQTAQYRAQAAQERMMTERVQKYQNHITILQTVSSRWSTNLKTVKFDNRCLDDSSQPLSTPPVLPKLVYGTLFRYQKLEILELKQWQLVSVEDFLSSMKSSGPKNLKQLHLPIDDPGSAISLSGLLDIAEACPMLESLHCCIDTLPPIPEHSIPTTKALSHGLLKSLFIATNPASVWDFNQILLVARHLYLTFPCLQTINCVEGPNAEQWVRIRDQVKMFQVIREDDMYRFSWALQQYCSTNSVRAFTRMELFCTVTFEDNYLFFPHGSGSFKLAGEYITHSKILSILKVHHLWLVHHVRRLSLCSNPKKKKDDWYTTKPTAPWRPAATQYVATKKKGVFFFQLTSASNNANSHFRPTTTSCSFWILQTSKGTNTSFPSPLG